MSVRDGFAPIALLAAAALAACSSTHASSDGGADSGGTGGGGASGDAALGDAVDANDAAEPLICGGQTCGDGQICVMVFCGGGPVLCAAPGDGGQCENGWQYQPTDCPGTGPGGASGPGCFPPPCQNPPPRCADRPAACGSTLSCGCITSAICGVTSCAMTSGRTVTCANQ
jgi:hypothetical protein